MSSKMASSNPSLSPVQFLSLRKKAEASMAPFLPESASLEELELRKTLHELQIHQVELEIQNEELRAAQIELAESRDRIANLFDFAPAGYLTLSHLFQILDANQTLAQALGVPRGELLGQRLIHFIDPEVQEEFCARLCDLGRGPQTCESVLRRADGSKFPVLMTMAPIEVPGLLQNASCRITITDISERKAAEEQLKELNQTLEQRVTERSAILAETNRELLNEIAERQRLEREIVEITEHERRYFGLELHDDICQQLFAIGLHVDLVANRLKRNDPKTAAELKEVSKMLGNTLERTRELSRGLHPTGLDSEGLVPALNALAHQVSMRVECVVESPCPELSIPQEAALHLCRIAQEAVSNALRHSRASRIEIALRPEASFLRLSIADNGIGLPPDRSPHLGIRSMLHRAKLIGATLSLDANVPQGTVVTCRMPLSAPANP